MSGVRWDGSAFRGAKIALILGNSLVTYLRDDKPGIPFPGLWDLPGGGREGGESPAACALREVDEEFGLVLDPAMVVWSRFYPSPVGGLLGNHFLVAKISPAHVAAFRFGSEGQRWELATIDGFLTRTDAIRPLQDRLRDYLSSGSPPELPPWSENFARR